MTASPASKKRAGAKRKKRMLDLAGGGDDGTTGLLGGGRASKDDPRIEAYGTVDEASSAIGLAKALSSHARVRAICEELQRGLYALGAELEKAVPMPDGFILPGSTPASGALDLARAVTRRAERRCLALERGGGFDNPQVRRWLNRLSLLLFVLARYEEGLSGRAPRPAKRSTRLPARQARRSG
jgi:cob(I)alamin adenosyltransferase